MESPKTTPPDYVPATAADWAGSAPHTILDTAVSIEWVLNLLAGGSYPAQGSAYDYVKAAWEAARASELPNETPLARCIRQGRETDLRRAARDYVFAVQRRGSESE